MKVGKRLARVRKLEININNAATLGIKLISGDENYMWNNPNHECSSASGRFKEFPGLLKRTCTYDGGCPYSCSLYQTERGRLEIYDRTMDHPEFDELKETIEGPIWVVSKRNERFADLPREQREKSPITTIFVYKPREVPINLDVGQIILESYI